MNSNLNDVDLDAEDQFREPFFVLPVPPSEKALFTVLQKAVEMELVTRPFLSVKNGIFAGVLKTLGATALENAREDGLGMSRTSSNDTNVSPLMKSMNLKNSNNKSESNLNNNVTVIRSRRRGEILPGPESSTEMIVSTDSENIDNADFGHTSSLDGLN